MPPISPLLEIPLALLFLSALAPSPAAFAYLSVSYVLAVKIVRSWLLRGCLPTTGGGPSSSGGGGTDDGSGLGGLSGGGGSGHGSGGDGRTSGRVVGGATGGAGSLSIKLAPLGREASALLERVMTGDVTVGDGHRSDDEDRNRHTASRGIGAGGEEDEEGCHRGDEGVSSTSNSSSNTTTTTTTMEEEQAPPEPKRQYRREMQNKQQYHQDDEAAERMEVEDHHDDDDGMDVDDQTNDNGIMGCKDGGGGGGGKEKNAIERMVEDSLTSYSLDCYPYSFSPLLLFANAGYFDRGYSNYNAVAAFFAPALRGLGGGNGSGSGSGAAATAANDNGGRRGNGHRGAGLDNNRSVKGGGGDDDDDDDDGVARAETTAASASAASAAANDDDADYYRTDDGGIDMLRGVVYDRMNLTYDELFNHVSANQCLVTCCIDAHFTAFQMINKTTLLYYDPLQPCLNVARGERDVHHAALYLLMKCHYGDNGHVHENEKYYTSPTSTRLQNAVFQMWKKINNVAGVSALGIRWARVPLNVSDRYLFVNSKTTPGNMSTQLTGNTCYFQTYLFALLCRVGKPVMSPDGRSVALQDPDMLERATIRVAQFLLTFFVDSDRRVVRPYTNSNFILDFYRYRHSPYYVAFVKYLQHKRIKVPSYDKQYEGITMFYSFVKNLHGYDKFVLEGATSSTPNSKSLQHVQSTEGASRKLGRGDYYKYRAVNLMFGCNAGAMQGIGSFSEFNAWRKNQLLSFYDVIRGRIAGLAEEICGAKLSKYRDYYFMPQFEVGQQELIDIHHYTYLIDMCSMGKATGQLAQIVHDVNGHLVNHIYFSTQNRNNYHKMMKRETFVNTRRYMNAFQQTFLSVEWFTEYLGLGFSDINPKEKDINSLTQTVFYQTDLMRHQGYRQEYEFEKECINQMARSNVRRFEAMFQGGQTASEKYEASIKIGYGFTYSKYNTLMHFLNVAGCYWANPDVNNIQLFGKDVRTLLSISCQKIFFDPSHCGSYYYGPLELRDTFRTELDLAVASGSGRAGASVASSKYRSGNYVTVVDRVYEFSYLKGILEGLFLGANNTRIKSDNGVLNLLLLSLQLDFGLFDEYASLLNIAFMKDLQHEANTRELQVEISNLIYDFDRKHNADSVTRSKVEELIFEVSYKFLINKNFDINSSQFKLISMLNADSDYQEYILLVKIYMSLCSINKSVEVDYYKIKVNGSFNIIIPFNFSKKTSEYLEDITKHHSFSENNGIMMYDDIHVFDLRPQQPEINLYRIRLEPSSPEVQSMVKYIEITNVFQALSTEEQYLIFIADNVILVDVLDGGRMSIRINKVDAKVATIYFNEAISFIPCFKYTEGEDVIIFTSPNIHNLVDSGGQFCQDYYGMKHELIECITSEELYVDLNDDPQFRKSKLSELLTESKVVVYFPDYMLLVSSRQHLINLLDYAIKIRNVGFFILVLSFLKRASILLEYQERNGKVVQITGPWKEAILYVLNMSKDSHYDAIFQKQFVDINQHKNLPLRELIEVLSENFTRYQRYVDGEYQIIPREKQKQFLEHIIRGDECFHFSEVGSGKTKVIMPLLCQIFLSNNKDAHKHLARDGKQKDTLVILVPEHLLPDARTQVLRHCLNLNFRQEYRIHDDILTLLNKSVLLGAEQRKPMKQIFVTSFNQFKKALTYDKICKKIMPHREHILIVADEVDDFLDRDKLVFNICSNKANAFDRDILEYFHEVSLAAYHGREYKPSFFRSSPNPAYWRELYLKFLAIHNEIQDASKSLNKSFGIFNESTLRHCATSISHDIEGYKALIARPYESVNRAMPGSYYSDVERTIFLTFVILSEDIAKYDELFQGERKFIIFEYWKANLAELDFDELVYGHDRLSEIAEKHPSMINGLIRFLYVIILKRMEVRDRSKSVNSIDVIFNFDCIGFTGTPFLDNYPTSDYIRHRREDDIPPCIDRSFYAYSSENLQTKEFEQRFARFQGQNSNVQLEYVSSDFMHESLKVGEMDTLEAIFKREEKKSRAVNGAPTKTSPFNVIVDLCGIFKLSSIDDVRSLILKHFGPDCFHYIYHIDQSDGSDRMLCIKSKNDVTFDEEFYKFLCRSYGATLREKVFFFIDNRNYIGKDVPYQLVYQKHYKVPLFVKSVVIAHDVEDFSKIWQAMGRSRTMNETTFSIYKNKIPPGLVEEDCGLGDIKEQPLTKVLYTRNCDCKMAGNLSSIYQTLIALYNLGQQSFYYSDEIVNTFIEKMENTIVKKVKHLEGKLAGVVLGSPDTLGPLGKILQHIFLDKFRRCSIKSVSENSMSTQMVDTLVRQIVRQKFEQRLPSSDIYDDYIRFLSGEQQSLMEISYTKQQQKQKQKQKAKSQDNDTMDVFDKQNQLHFVNKTPNYFNTTVDHKEDATKTTLSLPVSVPIFSMRYSAGGKTNVINVYPTIQFLYSHHIMPRYINDEVKRLASTISVSDRNETFCSDFVASVTNDLKEEICIGADPTKFHAEVKFSAIRQNPQFSLVGIQRGVYIIGMKDQFNIHDRKSHPLSDMLQYAVDEIGFVLFDKTNSKSVNDFGPYFIEQYILLEALSKQEVAQNVITYYCSQKEKLEKCLKLYDEKQGKGFICWRFLMNQTAMSSETEVDRQP